MKHRFHAGWILALWLLAVGSLRAQSLSVPWFVIAAGGGTVTSSNLSLTGTFGQWDATAQRLNGGIFSLTGGFWSFLTAGQHTVFEDTFSGNTIDPTKWITTGNSVVQSNGTMEVLTTVTDDGGVLTSAPFAIETNGLITITRQVFLHAQRGPVTNYPGTYFMGQFGINVTGLPQFSIYYADFDYGDGVTYMPRHGFFIARDGAAPLYIADKANVSAAITPLWDTWFDETVTYDPASGALEYFINNASQLTFNVGAVPAGVSPEMVLTFNAWGWWTGHEQLFQNLYVTQVAGTSNSAGNISLQGKLAFGGVAVGVTSNLTLTISNVGNATLNVSGIAYPSGYSGAFSGSIPAGGFHAVTVTFSPAAVSNYQGSLVVHSDAGGGVNTVAVSGYGASGNLVLTIDINGSGTVSPNLNGRTLVAGKNYTVRAVPKSGNVFTGWSGSTNSTKNPLTFAMQTNTLLEANFIASPFVAVKGSYNGLFSTTNGVAEETSGMLKGLTVAPQGTYSGTLLIGGGAHGISGTFSVSGQASNYISRPARQGGPLTVLMTLSLTNPPQITGTVSGTNNGAAWAANLIANRATNSGAGEFTMVLAPTLIGLAGAPPGYGYVLLSQHAGVLSLSGALADGTALNQTVSEDAKGNVPVYASLYGNTGLVTGWVNVSNNMFDGTLDWVKKSARTGLYTNGFTNELIVQGGFWTNRSPAPAITLPAGQLSLSGGNLAQSLAYTIGVSGKNTLTNAAATPTNSLTGNINPRTGLLTVIFGNGAGRATTIGKGAVLQATTNAAGFFLGKTNAGSLILDQ
jgi:hypothetical protein